MICDTTNEMSTATTCVTNSESSTPVCTPTCDVTTQSLTSQTTTQQSETNKLPPNATNAIPSSSEIKPVIHESSSTPDNEEIITTVDPGMTNALKI